MTKQRSARSFEYSDLDHASTEFVEQERTFA